MSMKKPKILTTFIKIFKNGTNGDINVYHAKSYLANLAHALFVRHTGSEIQPDPKVVKALKNHA